MALNCGASQLNALLTTSLLDFCAGKDAWAEKLSAAGNNGNSIGFVQVKLTNNLRRANLHNQQRIDGGVLGKIRTISPTKIKASPPCQQATHMELAHASATSLRVLTNFSILVPSH
jgi:hypothetical protein